MTDKELFKIAKDMTRYSYAPFSKFHVGAALLSKDGRVFTGCNVENSSYGGTICAERTAFVKAISEGCYDFEKIMITAMNGGVNEGERRPSKENEPADGKMSEAWPCGICRQFMKEFCDDDFIIMTAADEDHIRSYTLPEILPEGFRL